MAPTGKRSRRFQALVAIFAIALALTAGAAHAGFIDFEDGADGQPVSSAIPGVEFSATGGQEWVYGDWSTGSYQGAYPDGPYFSSGGFFAWLGPGQGVGNITFTQARATYFTVGYSAQYSLVLEAYDSSMNLLDTRTGAANLDTGQLDFLTVSGEAIALIKIKEGTGFGNYWVIDDIDTDAVIVCTLDAHCDDGDFCNGEERCVDYMCVQAEELPCRDDGLFCSGEEFCNAETQQCDHRDVPCGDDGLFCNGEESCSEQAQTCLSSGDPCPQGQICDEGQDLCLEEEPDQEDEDEDDEDLWPQGKVTGGCCGC